MALSDNPNATEVKIGESLVEVLLKDGFTITVEDGEEVTLRQSSCANEVKEAMCTTDWDNLYIYRKNKRFGHVWLIWGNDCDVITDWNERLDQYVNPIIEVAQEQ